MNRLIFLLVFFLLFSANSAFAQSMINGEISDEADNAKLENASIMLIQAKDSILVDFTRSDGTGKFQLKKPTAGDYVLIISYPKFGDYYSPIQGSAENSDLGPIQLSSVSQLLEEVLITGRIPIVIKGDTTEYDASSFKVEANAKVEDLLKVLPGISVDASGKITAQGKTVQKVLVDGEEFFGDDPTLVTRNIRSDMVDKVQVYEKKSEQSERTGVDDGERQQTINVKLKEGAKNGIFGKAVAGVATDDFYAGQLMFNKFKGSQKISAYGLFGNNGSTALSWEDAEKYGTAPAGNRFAGQPTDEFSGAGSIGIPRVINSGVNFSDKWKGDTHNLNVSYKYGRIDAEGNEIINTQNNTESGLIVTDRSSNVLSEKNQHKANLDYDLKIDTMTTLTIRANAADVNNLRNSRSLANVYDGDGMQINRDTTINLMENRTQSFGATAYLTRKFKKEGRSVTFDAFVNRNDNKGDGNLFSHLQAYDAGAIVKDTITDQRKDNQQIDNSKGASLTYTEPLSKVFNLSFQYGINKNDVNSTMYSYNRDAQGEFTVLDPLFSNLYNYDRLSNNYVLGLNYNTEKFRANLTNSLNDDALEQLDRQTGDLVKRSFLTYNPRLSVNYKITKTKGFWFNYSGSNQLPSLSQIQPIRDNSDNLNILIGNADLRPAFQNNFNFNFSSFKVLTGNYMYLGLNASTTSNAIVQNLTTDRGRTTYFYENLDNNINSNFSLYTGLSFKLIKKLAIENRPNLAFSSGINYNYIDGSLNKLNTQNYSLSYNVLRNTKKGLDFDFSLSPGYQTMESSLQPDVNSNGFTFGSNGNISYYLPLKFKLYVNYNYTFQAATKAFAEDFEQFLIHPGLSKKFLKSEALELDFSVNDLLNQNKGFSRSQNNSVFTQRRFDSIQRYYMLKLSWDFNKMFVN